MLLWNGRESVAARLVTLLLPDRHLLRIPAAAAMLAVPIALGALHAGTGVDIVAKAAGGLVLLFGGRRGMQIIGTSLGVLLLLGSVTALVA